MIDSFLNSGLGVYPEWLIWVVFLWLLPWKGVALWKASQNRHKKWYIALLVLNTFAVLEIIYIFYFSKKPKKENLEVPKKI